MHISALLLSSAIIYGAQAALLTVPPTSQCFGNEEDGRLWSCDVGYKGCQYDHADVPQGWCQGQKPNNDFDIGHNFCVDDRSALVIASDGGITRMWGPQCAPGVDHYGEPYEWLHAKYKWQCCTCPTGFRPGGYYSWRVDGHGGFLYNTTVTHGSIEKACVRCDGDGEALTWNAHDYEWTCIGGSKPTTVSTRTTSKTTGTVKISKTPSPTTHPTKTGGGGGGPGTTKTTKTTKKPSKTTRPTKKHVTKKKHHTRRPALVARHTQF